MGSFDRFYDQPREYVAFESAPQTAQTLINETRIKLKESDEVARADRARLEAAEKRLSEFETRAKTAEAQARENATALFRIEEAIRAQLLAKRLPPNKPALSA